MIDQNRIKKNVETFSFPRLSGTNFEKRAFNLALNEIKSLNFNPKVQNFNFSTFYSRVYPKISVFFLFLIMVILYLNIKAFFYPIILLIASGILITLFFYTRKPEKIKIGKVLPSQNLIVKLANGETKNEAQNVIMFCCHLDSKGQKISILVRIRAARYWLFSILIGFIFIIIKNFILPQFNLIFYIIGLFPLIVNGIATTLIIINTTNNDSNGAIDNASGIACVMELLHYYINPDSRLKHFDLWFIFTGAEECGTMGIRHFYNDYSLINKDFSIVFNFDAIGKSVFLFPGKSVSDKIRNMYIQLLNNDGRIKISSYYRRVHVGSSSDGYFLKKKNFQGFGIGDLGAYKYIHSSQDTVDKVDEKILKGLCEVITASLKEYDTNFNIKDYIK
ncbi:MAG: M28 family metallopeptidase [Candidatus Heimdallarchaeota archaeon]